MVTFRPYQSEDRPWIEDANVRFYQAAHDFDATFKEAVSEALNMLERRTSWAGGVYLVAETNKQLIGCIFLSPEAPGIGRVRLFYLEEAYRGRGIGKRLLRMVVVAAKGKSFGKIRVSTFDRHSEACRMYDAFGFETVKTEPSTSFGQDLIQIDYELNLAD